MVREARSEGVAEASGEGDRKKGECVPLREVTWKRGGWVGWKEDAAERAAIFAEARLISGDLPCDIREQKASESSRMRRSLSSASPSSTAREGWRERRRGRESWAGGTLHAVASSSRRRRNQVESGS